MLDLNSLPEFEIPLVINYWLAAYTCVLSVLVSMNSHTCILVDIIVCGPSFHFKQIPFPEMRYQHDR